jgi:hypothetical protein
MWLFNRLDFIIGVVDKCGVVVVETVALSIDVVVCVKLGVNNPVLSEQVIPIMRTTFP